MRGAAKVGRSNAYEPSLILRHHLAPFKFRFGYLLRLMYGYGVSHVVLESVLRGHHPIAKYHKSRLALLTSVFWVLWVESKKSVPYAVGIIAYHLGARAEYLAQQSRSDHEQLDASV